MVMAAVLVTVYYGVIITYSLYYMFASAVVHLLQLG